MRPTKSESLAGAQIHAPLCLSASRRRCLSRSVLLVVGFLYAFSSTVGCGPHENVQMIGFYATGGVATFTLNHRGWPAPMRWPGVTEVSVASEADDAELWHLVAEAPGGVPAKELTIVYGVVPRGFSQTVPVDGGRPKKLVTGQNYYIGAGGKECVFGVVFALPLVNAQHSTIGRRAAGPRRRRGQHQQGA